MATEYLQEKINHLRTQIQQSELELFNHSLIVEEAKVSTGNKNLDNQLKNAATTSTSHIAMHQRKLAVRRPLLLELEKELDENKPIS